MNELLMIPYAVAAPLIAGWWLTLRRAKQATVVEEQGHDADAAMFKQTKEQLDAQLFNARERITHLAGELSKANQNVAILQDHAEHLQRDLTTAEEARRVVAFRYNTLAGAHDHRIGGRGSPHDGGAMVKYECVCGWSVFAPEGFWEGE